MALPIIDPVIFALVLTLTGPGAQPPPEPAPARSSPCRAAKDADLSDCCVPPRALDPSAVPPSVPHFAAAPQPQERIPSHVEVH
jgi:hypothetical protein